MFKLNNRTRLWTIRTTIKTVKKVRELVKVDPDYIPYELHDTIDRIPDLRAAEEEHLRKCRNRKDLE
jgi:hypothetical protein